MHCSRPSSTIRWAAGNPWPCARRWRARYLDYGPGVPDKPLEAVLKPFYRLEHLRHCETGHALGGRLELSNRECGGLKGLPTVREAGLSTTVATP